MNLEVKLLLESEDTNHTVVEDKQGVELWLISAAKLANEPVPILHSQHWTTQMTMDDYFQSQYTYPT